MKYLELILIASILVLLSLKISGNNSIAIVFIISLTALSCLYFYLSFALLNGIGFRKIFRAQSYSTISRMRIIGSALTGFALSIMIIGILFKVQHYPGAKNSLLIGASGLTISLIFGVVKYLKTKSEFYAWLILRLLIFLGMAALVSMYIPVSS